MKLKRGEGPLHPYPKGWGIRDPLRSHCNKGNFNYILRVADNGKGIPKEIRFEKPESLGFQLVSLLIDQIDGDMELKRENGTEFVIWFNDVEASEPEL